MQLGRSLVRTNTKRALVEDDVHQAAAKSRKHRRQQSLDAWAAIFQTENRHGSGGGGGSGGKDETTRGAAQAAQAAQAEGKEEDGEKTKKEKKRQRSLATPSGSRRRHKTQTLDLASEVVFSPQVSRVRKDYLGSLSTLHEREVRDEELDVADVVDDEARLESIRKMKRRKRQHAPRTPTPPVGVERKAVPDPPAPRKTIRERRTQNLQRKSATTLMIDALLQHPNSQLRKLERALDRIFRRKHPQAPVDRRTGFALLHGVAVRPKFMPTEPAGLAYACKIDPLLLQVVRYALTQGADPTARDEDGYTPLLAAVQYEGGNGLVAMLLKHGVSGDDCLESERLTAVDLALRLGDVRNVRMLLQRGGLPSAAALGDGVKQPKLLDFARQHGFEHSARSLLEAEFWRGAQFHDGAAVASAVAHGVDVNLTDAQGKTALFLAVRERASLEFVEQLLHLGANPNHKDEDGTPLAVYPLLRSDADAPKIVARLLAHGLDRSTWVPETKQPLSEFARKHGVQELSE